MSEEDDELISRNFQIVKSAKQKLKLTKRIPLKSEIKKREYITDARRTYSQILLNAFNSCDIDKLKDVFSLYCRPDLHAVNLHEGGKNPTGANSTELKTVPILLNYWQTLFHSAPDFMFESQFVTAYTDTISQISIVRSKFRMTGTRILDVKVAQKANADVIKKKLKHKEQYSTSENDLMIQIHNQLSSTLTPAPAATTAAADANAPITKAEGMTEEAAHRVEEYHDDLFLDELIVLASDMTDNHSAVSSSTLSSITTATVSNAAAVVSTGHSSSTFSLQAPMEVDTSSTPTPIDTPATASSSYDANDHNEQNDKKRKGSIRSAAAESKALQREAAKRAKADAAKVSSLFASGESIVFNKDAQVYADKPLNEILKLKYKGTFGVYLDANNKIFRYEFIYTALDDATMTSDAVTSSASGDATDGSMNENNTNDVEVDGD